MFQSDFEARLFTFKQRAPHLEPLLQVPPATATESKAPATARTIFPIILRNTIWVFFIFGSWGINPPNPLSRETYIRKRGAKGPDRPRGQGVHGQATSTAPGADVAGATGNRDRDDGAVPPTEVRFVCGI